MTCHCTSMSRTCSTSRIQREVIQANGQSGSNQKSAVAMLAQSLSTGVHSAGPDRPTAVRDWRRGGRMRRMPGTNLTRDEAATRAALLDVTSYTVDLDLTTPPARPAPSAPITTLEFTCREPGASTFADLVARDRPRDHPQRRSPRPRDGVRRQPDRARRPRRRQQLVVAADCAYSNTGEGLHRFVDPVDDRVYLYTQFEVPDARRVFTTFEQPDLKAVFTFNVTAPVALGGRLQRRRRPSREPPATGRAARRSGASRRPSGCRPTSPRSSPASTTASSTPTRASSATIPLGHYCRQSLVEHLDADELVELTKQSFAFFEEQFDYPYPFEKYDQLYVPEYNTGRDGERRLRDAARRVPPPQPPGALVLRVPRLGDPPRDGAHVVRRPRHHEVVGRPLAQRVVRRVGLLLVRGRGHRVRRRVDRLRQRPQADRLPRRPAALDAPDRGRQRRPARRRGQLRQDHLRQGRLGAQAARRLGRPRPVPRRPARLLQGARVRQHRVHRPARRAREGLRPRARRAGPRSGCRPPASTRSRPSFELDDDGTLRRRSRCAQTAAPGLADAAPPPPRHRPLRRRSDER